MQVVGTKLLDALRRDKDHASPSRVAHREDKFFGVSLDLAVEQSLAPVPSPVTFLCEYIEKFLDAQGLFRIAGNKTKIDAIINSFKYEGKVVLDDVHDATGALKAFFRQMPEPLIPFSHYEGFVAIADMGSSVEEQKMLLASIISNLPVNNLKCLKYLMTFLNKVTQKAHVNMMSEENLAIVFAPNLLRPEEEDSTRSHKDAALVNKIVVAMIKYAKDVLPPEPVRPEIAELSSVNTQLEAERDQLRTELSGMRSCLQASLSAVAASQRYREESEKIKEQTTSELTALKDNIATLQQELAKLTARVKSEEEQKLRMAEELKTEKARMTEELKAEKAQVVLLTTQLTQSSAEVEKMRQAEQTAKEEHAKALQALTGQLLTMQQQIEEKKQSQAVTMDGVLSKRSSGLPHRWQKRTCFLNEKMLYWVQGDDNAAKAKTVMACVLLSEVLSVEDQSSSGSQVFTLHTKTKVGIVGSFTLMAPSAQEREAWVKGLSTNLQLVKASGAQTPRGRGVTFTRPVGVAID